MYICISQKSRRKKNTIGKKKEEKRQAYNNKTELIHATTSILYR
jgi:hypothetical protein